MTIDSSPPGATIFIDGKERGVQGYTAPTFKIRLTRGQHRVLLELEGFKPAEHIINVDQARKFTFTLDRAPAQLYVKSPGTNETARDAEVFVDGAPAGRVPVPVEVTSGRRRIEVRKSGYRIYSEDIEMHAGETRTLWVTLQSEVKAGSLLVGADARNAQVKVDGQDRGPAPVLVDNLPEGMHEVEVTRSDGTAPPWRQSIRVVAGQQQKVMVGLGQGVVPGSLLVVSDVDGAEVVVDGTIRGRVNREIPKLNPGQHSVDVRARGYRGMRKVVDIEPGQQRIEKVDLPQAAAGGGTSGALRVIMVNPVDGAQYYIDGRNYDEGAILSEQGVELSPGKKLVVVRGPGYPEVRKEVHVRPGIVETVTVELTNMGSILINSDPRGAIASLDGGLLGPTPYKADNVPAGPHTIHLELQGRQPFEEQVVVRGGEQATVSAQFPALVVVVSPEEGRRAQESARRGLSSFSAVTVDPGKFTADFATGFPYLLDLRLTVGVLRWGPALGLDAGVELRTTFYETDVVANVRAQLARLGPVAVGANIVIGGGGGPRERNGFDFEVGVPFTLIAGDVVRVTGRPYLQVYSDRLCPSVSDLQQLRMVNDTISFASIDNPESTNDVCTGGGDPATPGSAPYPNAIAAAANWSPTQMMFVNSAPVWNGKPLPYDPTNKLFQVNGTPVLDRFTGIRFMLQAVVEVALTRDVNFFVLIEGAPFQGQRQSYTDKFNRIFPLNDFPLYGRGGLTIKY